VGNSRGRPIPRRPWRGCLSFQKRCNRNGPQVLRVNHDCESSFEGGAASHLDYCGARNLCRRIGYSNGIQFGHGPGFRRSWEERGSEFISSRQNRKKSRQRRWRGNGFLVLAGRLTADIARQVVKYPAIDCSIGVFRKKTPFAFGRLIHKRPRRTSLP
jgi:hypothetical protein